jgi:hypothetical protein
MALNAKTIVSLAALAEEARQAEEARKAKAASMQKRNELATRKTAVRTEATVPGAVFVYDGKTHVLGEATTAKILRILGLTP